MTLTTEQRAMLQAPLDPKHVVKPSGSFGPKGDYLEGWHVINELNRVFGFDGWSYTIDLSRDALAEGKDSKGNDQWQAAYTCICTLKVGDVVRQDVGFGSGFAKSIGDAIEGATKEAATDALKRAARTFGNIFGLALYDKSRANVQAAPPPVLTSSQHDELSALCQGASMEPGVFVKKFNEANGAKVENLKGLPQSEYAPIKAALQSRIAKRAEQKETA